MARPRSRYVCQACGATAPRWEGRCHVCGAWDSLVETLVQEPARPSSRARARSGAPGGALAVPLRELAAVSVERLPTGMGELDRVLGGGLVAGSLVLLGGEPGIGKSTLLLEAAGGFARAARAGAVGGPRAGRASPGVDGASGPGAGEASVLYISGEESPSQVRLRAERLGLLADGEPALDALHVLAETDVELIIARAEELKPALLIVDSIQTVSLEALEGPAGSVGQIRESAARLLAFAKGSGTPVVLIGHVTKDGSLAGPKTLEHVVDAVLTLEGERFAGVRLLRATKNRFGSTEELGVFEMAGDGLREVADPARAFLETAAGGAPGSAVAALIEGSRPLLVEVQALVAPASGFGAPRRTVSGLDPNRLALLIAVLGRRAGVRLADRDVYASLAGGLSTAEPAVDLPLALALASSARDRPLRPQTVALGEVGLLGELRPAPALERRLREAVRLGFRQAVVPAGSAVTRAATGGSTRRAGGGRWGSGTPAIAGLEVVGVRTLAEALEAVLGGPSGRSS
ncbi:MAG TPA: AAA family ATPase [Candidatus Limnocylindrales bacterium]|nr:AAA family ATPase [Candidatus Limnocylindrales bacterium]